MSIQICVYGDVRKKNEINLGKKVFLEYYYLSGGFFFFFGAAVVQLMNNDTEFLESFKITFLSFIFSSWKF